MPILLPNERVGTVVADKYRLDGILGRGGMGVVFAGQHIGTGRPVAVKVLLPQYTEHEEIKLRFLKEARAAAAIHHPNVVDVLDIGSAEDGSLYIVLEFLEGESLEDRLDERGQLDPAETVRVLLPIIDAIAKAHDAGIVHRDLKPPNIFLSVDGRGHMVPKLLDFGIAKVVETDPGMRTNTGSVIGTPQYMSPEQARGLRELGAAADLWSLGVVAYECIAGRVPWVGDHPHALLLQLVTQAHPPVTALAPDCPEPIAAVIHRCLEKDVALRPADARELAAEFRTAAEACGFGLSHDAVPGRTSRPRVPPDSGSDAATLPAPDGDGPSTDGTGQKAAPDGAETAPAESAPPESEQRREPAALTPELEPARRAMWPWLAGGAALLLVSAGVTVFGDHDGGASTSPAPRSTPTPARVDSPTDVEPAGAPPAAAAPAEVDVPSAPDAGTPTLPLGAEVPVAEAPPVVEPPPAARGQRRRSHRPVQRPAHPLSADGENTPEPAPSIRSLSRDPGI